MRKGAGGVVLEIRVGLEGFAVEHAGDEIDRQACDLVRWQLVLEEIPAKPYNLVVTARLIGLIPSKQFALRVEHDFVPRQLGVQIVLRARWNRQPAECEPCEGECNRYGSADHRVPPRKWAQAMGLVGG